MNYSLDTKFSTNYNNKNQVSFQAGLRAEIPVKHAKKFLNIADSFRKKTEHYPYDEMVLCKSLDKSFSKYSVFRLNDETCICDYRYAHLIENFDEIMETMSENEIVKKLVRYFKMLKKEESYSNKGGLFDRKISLVEDMFSRYSNMSNAYKKRGNKPFADRYAEIAKRNAEKIKTLEEEKMKYAQRYIAEMEKIAEGHEELSYIPELYRDLDNIPKP